MRLLLGKNIVTYALNSVESINTTTASYYQRNSPVATVDDIRPLGMEARRSFTLIEFRPALPGEDMWFADDDFLVESHAYGVASIRVIRKWVK